MGRQGTGGDDPVILGEMLDAVGRRSFGPLLLLWGLVIVTRGGHPDGAHPDGAGGSPRGGPASGTPEGVLAPRMAHPSVGETEAGPKGGGGPPETGPVGNRLLRRSLTDLTGVTGWMVIAGTGAVLALIAENGLVALLSFIVTGGALAWALSAVV